MIRLIRNVALCIFCTLILSLTISTLAAPSQALTQNDRSYALLEARIHPSFSLLKDQLLEEFNEDWIIGVYGEHNLKEFELFDKDLKGLKVKQQQPYAPEPLPGLKRSIKGKAPATDSIKPVPLPPAATLANATLGYAKEVMNSVKGYTITAKGFTEAALDDKWVVAEASALKEMGTLAGSGKLSTWPVDGEARPVILMQYKGKSLRQYPCYQALRQSDSARFSEMVVSGLATQLKKELWRLVQKTRLLNANFHIDNIVVSADSQCRIKAVQIMDWAYPNVFITKTSLAKEEDKFDAWFQKRFKAMYDRDFGSEEDSYVVQSPEGS
ncbi:hypothetical protein F5050DRAFT_1735098 [Lentinula boryana]|uniref:Uncharacterized protein n=1 Tax=Lentinula boryana TaxID=40481 RepID=A0ABQ8QMW3_9AGAR|nr:hypothetical protein F5050DRAFT_1735098 [Lentinula boryana]